MQQGSGGTRPKACKTHGEIKTNNLMHSLEERSWNTGCLSKMAEFFCTAPRAPGSTAEVAVLTSNANGPWDRHTHRRAPDTDRKEIGNASRDELRQLIKCRLSKYLLHSCYCAIEAMARSYSEECNYLEQISPCCYKIKKGFVPNMKVSPHHPQLHCYTPSPGCACCVGGGNVLCEWCLEGAHVWRTEAPLCFQRYCTETQSRTCT